jgi:hypothetical protein
LLSDRRQTGALNSHSIVRLPSRSYIPPSLDLMQGLTEQEIRINIIQLVILFI